MLSARGRLAVAELVFYTPAFFIALWVAFRHGFNRRAGWVFLVILSLIRIIGWACQLAAETLSNPSIDLIRTAIILSSVGLSPLILAMLGLLSRVHSGMPDGRRLPQRTFDLLILPTMVALILAIVGGSNQASASGHPSTSGRTQTRVAVIIFVAMFFIQSIITIFTFANIRIVSRGDKQIYVAVALSIPFLLVRLIYSLLAAFDTSSSTFSLTVGNVIIEAFMSVLEEFVIVILYLAAGIIAPKLAKGDIHPELHLEARGATPRYPEAE